MVHVLKATALALTLASVAHAASATPAASYAVEAVGGRCHFVSGARRVSLALRPPCWLAADDSEKPYRHRASPGADTLIVVSEPYHGSFLQGGMKRCGSKMQAVTVSVAELRANKRVEHGLTCRGQAPDPARWWVLEHDPPASR